MSTARSFSCLLAKLALTAGVIGMGVGAYYAISPNFNVVKVNVLHAEPDKADPTKTVDRVYNFELSAGSFNYYEMDPTTITSKGNGEQNSSIIVDLVDKARSQIKSYKSIYELWQTNDDQNIIKGLTIENREECANEFKKNYDSYAWGIELLMIFGGITIISIIWMIINANIEHRHKQKLRDKKKQLYDDGPSYPLLII